MKNQHNSFHVKHELDSSISSDKDYSSYNQKQSYKLYSSQRLTHAELPVTNYNHPKSEFTASQIYQNLNNSLDGLFTKIEALKQEHTIQQKIHKINKKINMDLSNFPMPNLAAGQFTVGKPLGLPNFVKPRQKKKIEDKIVLTQPFQQITQGSKAISSATQHYFIKGVSSQNIFANQYPIKDGIPEARNNRLIPYLEPQTKQNLFNKNNLHKGLLNMQNVQMKVSMEVSDFNFKNTDVKQGALRLDKIIEKQTYQTDIIKKSIIFNHCNIKDFQLGKNVGSGKFGDVHICRHKETGFMFALKKIFKSTILQYNMINQFTRQLKIHYRLDHPNIIKLYSHFDDQYHIFLLMEYAQGGILMNKLKCAEEIASRYIDQTIDAVQYLHKLKIAHRDIKPQNIVLQFTNVIKLCDFGWASYYDNEMKTTFCGTLDYLSPQMKQGGQYDNSVDIWSIGVLTYQLLTGNPPYRKQLMLAMRNGVGPSKPGSRKVNWAINYPSYISPLAQSFIRNLLKENPEERATLRLCSTHTFIKKYQQNLQVLVYYNKINKVIGYNNQSPQKFGSNDYLAPMVYTATNINPSSREISAFNYAFNNLNI